MQEPTEDKRSRSPRRDSPAGSVRDQPGVVQKASTFSVGSLLPQPPAQKIITHEEVAQTLPKETFDRLTSLYEDGSVKRGDFDPCCLAALRELTETLQDQVMTHLENERVFMVNARSKSGFLYSLCEKAKQGCLDVRGFGNPDPWGPFLVSQACPRSRSVELVNEGEWLQRFNGMPVDLVIDTSADTAARVPSIQLSMRLDSTVADLKARLIDIGFTLKPNHMGFRGPDLGFLRDTRTLAYYNLQMGSSLVLTKRERGGVTRTRSHMHLGAAAF